MHLDEPATHQRLEDEPPGSAHGQGSQTVRPTKLEESLLQARAHRDAAARLALAHTGVVNVEEPCPVPPRGFEVPGCGEVEMRHGVHSKPMVVDRWTGPTSRPILIRGAHP